MNGPFGVIALSIRDLRTNDNFNVPMGMDLMTGGCKRSVGVEDYSKMRSVSFTALHKHGLLLSNST